MATSEEKYLRELSESNLCPNCGKDIPPGARQVRGPGAFCSLECVAQYHGAELVERARRVAKAAERHRNS